jgi:hypothetical protein
VNATGQLQKLKTAMLDLAQAGLTGNVVNVQQLATKVSLNALVLVKV